MIELLNAEISILGVLAAVVVNTIVGMVWFGPLFGKKWAASIGRKLSDLQPKPIDYILSMLGALLTAITFSFFIFWTYVLTPLYAESDIFLSGAWTKWEVALLVATLAWVGSTLLTFFNLKAWEERSWDWFIINTLYYLVSFVLMALTIVAFLDFE